MLYTPANTAVGIAAFTILFAAIVIAVAIFILKQKNRRREKAQPHRGQIWLGIAIGIGIPALIFAYTLFFSPAAEIGSP